MAKRYRTRIAEVEAMRWDGTGQSRREIADWAKGAVDGVVTAGEETLLVRSTQGEFRSVGYARTGDWIVRDADGQFTRCGPASFALLYEPRRDDG